MAGAETSEAQASRAAAAMLKQASTERQAEFAQAVLDRAFALFRNGQLDSADVLLETMEQELVVRQRVMHLRGVIALYRGEDENALDFLEEAIRLEPADADAHANLGGLLLKSGQYPQALAAYAAALTLQPDNAAARLGLPRALAGSDLPDLAVAAFRDGLTASPEPAEAPAAAALAELLDAHGGREDAKALLDEMLARHPDHEALLRIAHEPAEPADGAEEAAGAVDMAANADRGTDPVTAVALRMTATPRVASATLCEALFMEGCRHHRGGDIARSRRFFERILEIDPAHVNALCNLGSITLARGDVARAQILLQSAVTLAPGLAPARIAFADALMAGGRFEQAGVHYRKALELLPDSDLAHAQYAMALRQLGDLDGAMTHFLAATRINQQQSPRFYEGLGRTCAARGNSQGAEISLKHALALDRRCVSAHHALGELYLGLGRPADAEAAFRAALALDPSDTDAQSGVERARSVRACEASGAP
ncbi:MULTISPECIES: tetratricopeptide repeat protein [unclassified Bradyrhizobium]|uniref:tetratricopeptide repeat protein n=1 Tax=unclassified Bradyrhizobium TaxID=2631580 RepID=UPI0028E75BC4|nr:MULTISPECIES: tetratricopeptide repeat protein [unclassified Bradyrhizobium]